MIFKLMLLFLLQDQVKSWFALSYIYSFIQPLVFVRLRDVILAEEDAKAILTGCVATDESTTSN